MAPTRRRLLHATAGLGTAALAGCLGVLPHQEDGRGGGDVSYDRPLTVENGYDDERSVRVAIAETREESAPTVYHAETYTVPPGDHTVFDFRTLPVRGDRELTVTATFEGRTERETIRTIGCYGTVYVVLSAETGFDVTYVVC